MKSLLFAAALSVSSLALAQSAAQTTQPATPDTAQPTTTQPSAQDTAQPANAQPTTQGTARSTDQGTAQPSGQTVDDPSQSTGPRGVTQQGTVPDGQTSAGAREYPPCSRTVTDGCIQTYEKGVRAARSRR